MRSCLVLILSLAAVTLAAIHPIDKADSLKVRGESLTSPKTDTFIHQVLRQLRAAGAPTKNRFELNDPNNRAIIQYSGNDSKVS